MSDYPLNNPSENLDDDIWTSGDYTPFSVCRNIIDNHTPINKNGMVNSLGKEISLVQNFVNNKYLGRSSVPINSGYFKTSYFDTLVINGNDDGSYVSGLIISGTLNGRTDIRTNRQLSIYSNGMPEGEASITILDEGDVEIPYLSISNNLNVTNASMETMYSVSGDIIDLQVDRIRVKSNYVEEEVVFPDYGLTISGDNVTGGCRITSQGDVYFAGGYGEMFTQDGPEGQNTLRGDWWTQYDFNVLGELDVNGLSTLHNVNANYIDCVSGHFNGISIQSFDESTPVSGLVITTGDFGSISFTVKKAFNIYMAGAAEDIDSSLTVLEEGDVSIPLLQVSGFGAQGGTITDFSSDTINGGSGKFDVITIKGDYEGPVDALTITGNFGSAMFTTYDGMDFYGGAGLFLKHDASEGYTKIYGDSKVVDLQVQGSIFPQAPNDIDCGTTGLPWKDVYASGLVLENLCSYASIAAAVSVGRPVGTVFRSGDYLCVVH